MPAEWQIRYWPECKSHVFLSHCQEDRDELVMPVYKLLQQRGIVPWIDRHHYPTGRDAHEVLREELLACRHVAYFITPALLRQGRGWAAVERAYSAAIQAHLRHGDDVAHVELPLLFVPPRDQIFLRSIWRSLIDKAMQCQHWAANANWLPRVFSTIDDGKRHWTNEHFQWAVQCIEDFIRQEETWALELSARIKQDVKLGDRFGRDSNLLRRLLVESPPRLPIHKLS